MSSTLGQARAPGAPELYFYPPPYKLPNGSLSPSILTVAAEQITDLFPSVKEMDGVVLLVAWNQLCPRPNACDFALIDRVLNYWGPRGKKVVLSLSTMGFPVKVMVEGKERFLEETPEWVLRDVRTYPAHSPTIGVIAGMDVSEGSSHVDTAFPSHLDQRFLSHVSHVVQQLAAKYDGNPVISYVRIGTGLLGEDNPIPPSGAGLLADQKIPGFTVASWLSYCDRITSIYLDAFHRSQLEFDISFLPAAYGRVATQTERIAIERFIQFLSDKRVFVAFNGLESADLEYLHATSGPAPVHALNFLRKAKQNGDRIGLEEVSPIVNPRMQNVSAMAEAVKSLGADRIVLFGIDAGAINFARNGANPTNASTVQFVTGQGKSPEATGREVEELLHLIGY
jgi:hypothetical protein